MHERHTKIIIDTNLWISFLIGMKTSAAIRHILTDGTVNIVMTDILQQEILKVASRPKFVRYFAPEACQRLLDFLRNRSDTYPLNVIPQRCRDPKDDYLLELAASVMPIFWLQATRTSPTCTNLDTARF